MHPSIMTTLAASPLIQGRNRRVNTGSGSNAIMLRRGGRASPNLLLCIGIMVVYQIHCCGLQLGIDWIIGFGP